MPEGSSGRRATGRMPEANLQADGGPSGKPCIEKTQSRSYGGKIMIVCTVSGGPCSARHGRNAVRIAPSFVPNILRHAGFATVEDIFVKIQYRPKLLWTVKCSDLSRISTPELMSTFKHSDLFIGYV
ncbi:hypothetical protein GUJ93_ZPchr0002g24648 [Zizania palustris]|uniref:Uncharacterized protein n=1 Tax=Zizania palustris TaxID=103762 RepID=A0A8J5V9M7_ZIZPA|nr:hypothetical protein GUJ93_ZPchr0002g24648 [Zizania palustris]